MRNPLIKRLPRELRSDIGKYIALFLFLTLTIGFVSGFLVADNSMKISYDESFEKYSIEHGHFILEDEASADLISDVEAEFDITVYELFCKNKETPEGHNVRFFKPREEIDRLDVMDGRLPEKSGEIIIDRLYAENNGISIGDTFTAGDMDFEVTGVAAFSDYSALFKNNTDMMFDANKFTVASVTEDDFDALSDAGLEYQYAWLNSDDSLSDEEQKEKADNIMAYIAERAKLTDFVCRPDNNAIMFTGNDMGGDAVMIHTLLYIVMVVLSFAFAVTTKSTIEQEAPVIGTLRASGYTKRELLGHYLALPLVVTIAAAIAGNIIGYTGMKFFVADMYYHSYSLPTYKTRWNADAFISTTLVPALIILVINFLMISRALSLTPLQFIRRDLSRKHRKKAVKLPEWKFLTRFRTRVILQNIPAYITLFFGIFFSCVLLMFGMLFSPLLAHFKEDVINSKISEYQYLLKAPVQTSEESAEPYCIGTLENDAEEEITIYGISAGSRYFNKEIEDGKVYVSDGLCEKYRIKGGSSFTLHDKYTSEEYTFDSVGKYDYPASLCVFMSRDMFNETFGYDKDYFNGYFSDSKIGDIDENLIAATITEHDLTIMADQLDDSMGRIFPMFGGFGIIIFILMIYLLAKLIIERNASSISMVKILGYSSKESAKLYNTATAIAVAISLLIAVPLTSLLIKVIYYTMMMDYSGWLTYYCAPWIYPAVFVMGAAGYTIVSFILLSKIKKIPLSQALKNME